MANLDPFYQSLLISWHTLNPEISNTSFPLKIIRSTPLYASKLVDEDKLKILEDWKKIGFKSLEDLMEPNGNWKTLQLPNENSTVKRRISYNYNKIKIYFNTISHQTESQQPQKISYKFHDFEGKLIVFPAPMKTTYLTSLHTFLQKPHITGKTIWLDKKINWASLHCYPTERKDSDISWRLLHNALVTPRKLNQWKIINASKCPWCDQDGNAMHMFFHCNKTTPLWNYVSRKIEIINKSSALTCEQALIGFPSTNPASKLSNYLLALAKSTIYRTYMNLIKEEDPPPPNYLNILERRIQYRLTLEEHHASLTKTENKFRERFLIMQLN